MCLRGTAKICIFDNIHILAKNELAVILPGQLVSITELSPDFLCNIVVLSRALFDDTLSGFSRFSPLFFVYMRSHYWYELTGEEIERFKLFMDHSHSGQKTLPIFQERVCIVVTENLLSGYL